MTPKQKLARRLNRKAERLTDENYHEEADVFFSLESALTAGKFDIVSPTGVNSFDGAKIIEFLT